MTPQLHAQAKKIFLAAVDAPSRSREALIVEQCAGDAALEREVRGLLSAHSAETLPPPKIPRSLLGTLPHVASAPDDSTAAVPKRAEPGRPTAPTRGEFPPGTIIDDRYRIVSRLGAGGMGQVYRADDLTLDQPVALKFLPDEWARDPRWIAMLRNEAKLARTVTHPNVCRIHDLCEWKGEFFLSMEYVDGEDLATLLRRIGRLPVDKAAEVTRQICLGLAVAHNANVLHRDLKPANIMLDSRGQVRITDFGIAAVAKSVAGPDIRTGTAAYMAPEQIAGREVSAKSDLYALGLVVYELFTGRQAFRANSAAEYLELHEKGTATIPSEHTPDIPRDVEQAILACLRKDPDSRPSSALMVAAAMPGSDVLADAMAANLTPGPELVAAARSPLVAPRTSIGAWAVFSGLLLLLTVGVRAYWVQPWDDLGKLPPNALAERARTVLAGTGNMDAPGSAWGYCEAALAYEPWRHELADGDLDYGTFTSSIGGPVFWYRTGNDLEALGVPAVVFGPGRVTVSDPSPYAPGMSTVVLDRGGRLLLFARTQRTSGSATADPKDFAGLMQAAGLNASDLALAEPPAASSTNSVFVWQSPNQSPENPTPVAIGRFDFSGPFFFAAATATSESQLPESRLLGVRSQMAEGGLLLLFVVMAAVALPLAWQGYRSGKVDLQGGMRLAAFCLAAELLVEILRIGGEHTFLGALIHFAAGIVRALGMATLLAVFYVVVDLYARRHWPSILITWNRATRFKLADPDVRRHIGIGVFVGCIWAWLKAVEAPLVAALGWQPAPFLLSDRIAEKLYGARDGLASYIGGIPQAIGYSLVVLMVLVAVRMVTRGPRLAMVLAVLALAPVFLARGAHPVSALVFTGLGGVVVALWLLTRVGLLSLAAALLVAYILNTTPISPSLSLWYADVSLFGVAIVVAIAAVEFVPSKSRSRA